MSQSVRIEMQQKLDGSLRTGDLQEMIAEDLLVL